MQSLVSGAFQNLAETDGLTFGAKYALSERLNFSAEATVARTRSQQTGAQLLAVSDSGITSTAFDLSMNVSDVYARGDRLRLAVSQPLHLESGALDYTGIGVTDRTLGLIGPLTRQIGISSDGRPVALEALYSVPILDGSAEIAGFLRSETTLGAEFEKRTESLAGASFKIEF